MNIKLYTYGAATKQLIVEDGNATLTIDVMVVKNRIFECDESIAEKLISTGVDMLLDNHKTVVEIVKSIHDSFLTTLGQEQFLELITPEPIDDAAMCGEIASTFGKIGEAIAQITDEYKESTQLKTQQPKP